MTDRDHKQPPPGGDDFEDFLAEFEPPAKPSAHLPTQPAPASTSAQVPTAPSTTVQAGVDVDFDFDDDGATRVGQIPAELLAALGRATPEDRITQRPPAPEPDELEVSIDELETSPSPTLPPEPAVVAASPGLEPDDGHEDRPTLVFEEPSPTAQPVQAPTLSVVDEDDDLVVETGDEGEIVIDDDDEGELVFDGDDEVVLDMADDEPASPAPVPAVASAAATRPEPETPPVLTLTGKDQLRARARALGELAAGSTNPRSAWLAAGELAERADAQDADTYFAHADDEIARRSEVRRGRRTLDQLQPGDLGRDVHAASLLRRAISAARSADEKGVATLLDEASSMARNPGLARIATLALAQSVDRLGDEKRATAIRLRVVGDDATPGIMVAIAREQLAQGDGADAAATLERAVRPSTDRALASAIARWVSVLDESRAVGPAADSTRAADLADLAQSSRGAARSAALAALAPRLGDEARGLALATLASTQAAAGALEEATASFESARRISSRSALVDAVRDASARCAAEPGRLAPTPAQDDADGGPLSALGSALLEAEASDATVAAIAATQNDVRAAETAIRLLGDVAANVGDPNAWLGALAAERREGEGSGGLATASAIVLARAGDRASASIELGTSDQGVAAVARMLLTASSDRDGSAAILAASADRSVHTRTLGTRMSRTPSVATLRELLAASPSDLPVALRLEQQARSEGHVSAASEALEALARCADDEVDRRKLRLLAASGGDAASALELAPDDPILLAEALLAARVPSQARDRALAALSVAASPIVTAVLHARAATLAQVDGSPADAALQLRTAHDAVPNEPSLRVSVELAELAAEQPARIAHRFFSVARADETDPRARARAFARLAELDLHERADATAAIASLNAVLDLAPAHVPTLRSLEILACDRSETDSLAELETQLAAALVPGRSADAQGRYAIRLRFARGGQPSADTAPVALNALERGTSSTRMLRWAEHAARYSHEGGELTALGRRLALTSDAADRAELALRMATYALRRGDRSRALAAVDEALSADPNHTVALVERSFLLDGDAARIDAALAHEAAASAARSARNASRHLVRAAELREMDGDREGARRALEGALARAPGDADALGALVELHVRAGDLPAAIAAIDQRIAVASASEEAVEWNRRKAALAEQGGDSVAARAAYVQLLAATPEDADVLRRVADLSLAAGDGPAAIDAFIRLARLRKASGELASIFLGLGECYERLTPDAKRAEASYRRVIQFEPTHPVAHERLVAILSAQSRRDEALATVDALDQAAPGSPVARALRLDVARSFETSGDHRTAETLLDGLRRAMPTDIAIQLELARFYEDRGGGPPLSMHLTRALADLRRTFEEHPSVQALQGLLDLQRRRSRPDAVACIEAVASTLGLATDRQGNALASTVPGAGRKASTREVDEAVSPRSLPDGTRSAFRLAGAAIEHAFPFDPKAFQAEKVGKDVPIRAEALAAAQWFGFEDVVLLVTPAAPRICVPVASTPLTIVIGRELPMLTTEAERQFLFARAAKIAASGLAFSLRMQPQQVAFTVHALVHAHDPTYAPAGSDPVALEQASRTLAKHLHKDNHELGPLCIEMGTRPNFEPQRIGSAAAELGDRVALISTGHVLAGVSGLLRLGGRDLDNESGFDARLALVRSMPEAWGLLLFALSDVHAEARSRTGAIGG